MSRAASSLPCLSSVTSLLALLFVVALVAPAAPAQADQTKRALTHDDYDGWQSIRGRAVRSILIFARPDIT